MKKAIGLLAMVAVAVGLQTRAKAEHGIVKDELIAASGVSGGVGVRPGCADRGQRYCEAYEKTAQGHGKQIQKNRKPKAEE